MPGSDSVYRIRFDFQFGSSLMGSHPYAVAFGIVLFWILAYVGFIVILPVVFGLQRSQLPGWCYTVSVIAPIPLIVLLVYLGELHWAKSRKRVAAHRVGRLRSLARRFDCDHRCPHRIIELALYEHQRRRSSSPEEIVKGVKETLVGIEGNPVVLINCPVGDWRQISPHSTVPFEPIRVGEYGRISEVEPGWEPFIEEEEHGGVGDDSGGGGRKGSLATKVGDGMWILLAMAMCLALLALCVYVVITNPVITCGAICLVIFLVFAYTVIVGKETFLVPGGVVVCSQPVWRRRPVIQYASRDESLLLVNFTEGSSYVVFGGKAIEIAGTNDVLWAWMNRSRKPTVDEIRAFLCDQASEI